MQDERTNYDRLIGVTASEQKIIAQILQKHVAGREIWAFGSRVSGKARPYSDLDLVILGDTALSWETRADLTEDFTQSDLRFKVDLVDWASVSDDFRQIIAENKIVLQK